MSVVTNVKLENYDINLNDLSRAIAPKWHDLARELKLSDTAIDSINNDSDSDDVRAYEMLQLWRNSNQSSDSNLQQALINVNFDFLNFISQQNDGKFLLA